MKTYLTAGVSKLSGKFALRGTRREGNTYAEILKKEGHTDVLLVVLPKEMNKDEIRKFLLKHKSFQSPEVQACLKDGDVETSLVKEEEKEVKAAKAKIVKPAKGKAPQKKKAAKSTTDKDEPEEVENDSVDDDSNKEEEAKAMQDADADTDEELPPFLKHVEDEDK